MKLFHRQCIRQAETRNARVAKRAALGNRTVF